MQTKVPVVLLCLACVGLLFVAGALRVSHPHATPSNQPMVLVFQQTGASYAPSERISAVRIVSSSAETLSDSDIVRLSSLIISEHNPEVKVEVAEAIGKVAAAHNKGSADAGRKEEEMLTALASAFTTEAEPSVRAKIVSAASAFNDSRAADLIAKGEQDNSQEVRAAAKTARQERDNRRLLQSQWPLSFKWK